MATLPSDIITSAFLNLGVIQPGDSVSSPMQGDAFTRLNQMVQNWSAEGAMVYNMYHQSFSLTPTVADYTVGTSGSLTSTATPVKISSWRSQSGRFNNGGKAISYDEFATAAKDPLGTSSALVALLAADNAIPMNIRVSPTPDSSAGALILNYWAILAAFASVSTPMTLPLWYEQALHWGLAEQLYGNYQRPGVSLEYVADEAKVAKDRVMALYGSINGTPNLPQAA